MPHYTVDQLLENCRMMDMNKDSLVDLNEFLEAFRLCQNFQCKNLGSIESNGEKEIPKKEAPKTESLKKPKEKEAEKEENNCLEQDILDQYEIQETFESTNKKGVTRRSSIISIESLSNSTNLNHSETPLIIDDHAGQTQNHKEQSKENHANNNKN